MKKMTDFFNDITEWCPIILVILLWVIVFPVRVICLALLPLGAGRENHKLHKVHEFFLFDD